MAPITLNDVAIRAGVSKKTVSRVLNNEPTVAEDTLQKVNQAMSELEYVPNTSARRLSSGKSMTIGVTVGWHIHDAYASSVIKSAFRESHLLGYSLSLFSTDDVGIDHILNAFRGRQVDGFILDTPSSMVSKLCQGLEHINAPYVVINPNTKEVPTFASYVRINDEEAMQDCTEHLIQLGHRKIGYVMADPNFVHQADRLRGHQNALSKAGIPERDKLFVVKPHIVGTTISYEERGYEAGISLIAKFPELTAIMGATDGIAMGILKAAWHLGLKVPDDISVTGFDDIYYVSTIIPPLTTIHQPMDELAAQAVQLLIERINHPFTDPVDKTLTAQLIVRKSCKSPRTQSESIRAVQTGS